MDIVGVILLMLSTSIAVVDDGGNENSKMVARRFMVVFVCLDGKSVMVRYVLRNVDVE